MKIAFFMPQSFPYGIAYSSRAQNFCRALSEVGHDVDLICDYLSDEACQTSPGRGQFEHTGIFYLREKKRTSDRFTVKPCLAAFLEKYLRAERPDVILSSSAYDRFPVVLRAAEKHGIPLILESCEKYDASNWRFGKRDPRYYQFRFCWKWAYPKADGVIAISRFLEEHYSRCGRKTLRIPTILDVGGTPARTECAERNERVFAFAGRLGGGKDRLAEFIRAMRALGSGEGRLPVLRVYGPTREEVEKQLGEDGRLLEELQGQIRFFGRIPQQQVADAVRACDFSLVLRPERESSDAGFPTKLAESMAVGTPVLANRTGDIGLYVQDGRSGLLAASHQEEDILPALRRACRMSPQELAQMRRAARETAEGSFDYRAYEAGLSRFITEIKNGGKENGISDPDRPSHLPQGEGPADP